ncbi:MAG: hypothetical protein V2B18_00290 [Pseudomonadota bacterium]
MNRHQILTSVIAVFFALFAACAVEAGPPFPTCGISGQIAPARAPQGSSGPECGLELTCTDHPVVLGHPQGVCFRATCPGIWAVMHTRMDQASFRKRFLTYRHYSFRGRWELKDQGIIESGPVPVRELFLVLPEDLLEFKLSDPDCHAKVEIRKLGYIKTGSLKELQEWLAYNSYMEKAGLNGNGQASDRGPSSRCLPGTDQPYQNSGSAIRGLFSVGRALGLPFPDY